MEPDPGGLSRDDEAPDLIDIDESISAFDLLKRAAQEKVIRSDVTLPVPGRDGMAVRYTVEGLNPARMQSINRRARAKNGEVDNDTVNALVLAEQCAALIVNGTTLTDEGRPLRFGSTVTRDGLGVRTAADAVRTFYGGESRDYGFSLMRHANDLMRAAGLLDDVDGDELDSDDEDPSSAAR